MLPAFKFPTPSRRRHKGDYLSPIDAITHQEYNQNIIGIVHNPRGQGLSQPPAGVTYPNQPPTWNTGGIVFSKGAQNDPIQ